MPTVHQPPDVAAVTERSDERDAQLRLRHEAFREGFRTGYDRGRSNGRAEAEREMAAAWARIAKPIARGGPTFAELELRRWGPGGRARYSEPRPGEYKGRGA